MSYTIIEHPKFSKLVKKISKKYKTIDKDIEIAKKILSVEPDQMTDYVPGFARQIGKFRMPISGWNIGKSGGCRIIFHKHDNSKTIRLLFIYSKSEKEDVSNEEIESILIEIERELNSQTAK